MGGTVAAPHKGSNFEIEESSGLVRCRVWRRPDLSREDGAKSADALAETLVQLAADTTKARSFVLDLLDAPPAGPLTQRSLERIMAACAAAKRRIAVVVSEDPLHLMQMRRIVGDHAREVGRVFSDRESARLWAMGG